MTMNESDFNFSDEPAELVPDDDPAVIAGMLRRATAKLRDAAVREERFDVDRSAVMIISDAWASLVATIDAVYEVTRTQATRIAHDASEERRLDQGRLPQIISLNVKLECLRADGLLESPDLDSIAKLKQLPHVLSEGGHSIDRAAASKYAAASDDVTLRVLTQAQQFLSSRDHPATGMLGVDAS